MRCTYRLRCAEWHGIVETVFFNKSTEKESLQPQVEHRMRPRGGPTTPELFPQGPKVPPNGPLGVIFLWFFPKHAKQMGFLPSLERIVKVCPSLEVTRYSYRSPSIPIDPKVSIPKYSYRSQSIVIYSDPASAQVVCPSLEVTRHSYRSPSIPIDPKVQLFTVIPPLPRWCAPASKLPGIPIDPQVFL